MILECKVFISAQKTSAFKSQNFDLQQKYVMLCTLNHPAKPPARIKQTLEEVIEDKCLAGARILFGGPMRLEAVNRNEQKKVTDITVVKTRNRFCKDEGRALAVESALKDMNKTVCEAYLLANLHVIRICKAIKPLPAIDQSFFYNCLKGVSVGNRQKSDIKDPDLKETADLYASLRPAGYQAPRSDHLAAGLHQNASQQMAINAKNYISMTFYKRLTRYLRHRYQLDGREAYKTIDDIYALQYDGDDTIVKKYRTKIPRRPTVGNLEGTPELYLPVLFEILQYCEKHNPFKNGDRLYDSRVKQVRLFTLLPTKQGFECSNVKICGTGLFNILKRQGLGWTQDEFDDAKEEWWRALFRISDFETRNKKFANEILTDGVSVSIVMRRLKPEDQVQREAEIARKRKEDRENPVKKKRGRKKDQPTRNEITTMT